jgi:hypothetical protein
VGFFLCKGKQLGIQHCKKPRYQRCHPKRERLQKVHFKAFVPDTVKRMLQLMPQFIYNSHAQNYFNKYERGMLKKGL